jgi:hypothetical protein
MGPDGGPDGGRRKKTGGPTGLDMELNEDRRGARWARWG